jgi:hypothetical protein
MMAQDVEKKGANDALSVFSFNAVPGFARELEKLNADHGAFRALNDSEPAMYADSFVFFLRSEADLDLVPEVFVEAYNSVYPLGSTGSSAYIEFTLTTGRLMRADYIFLNRYPSAANDAVACSAAVSFFWKVTRIWPDAEQHKRFNECLS